MLCQASCKSYLFWAWQVMGAHLRRYVEQPDRWRSALHKLCAAQPLGPGKERLFARLRLSYDMLTEHQQRMFLDTACFFLGKRTDTAKHVWERFTHLVDDGIQMAMCGFAICSLFYSAL